MFELLDGVLKTRVAPPHPGAATLAPIYSPRRLDYPSLYGPLAGYLRVREEAGGFSLSINPVVTPVLDLLAYLSAFSGNGSNFNLTPAAGSYINGASVPSGKYWILLNVERASSTSATQVALRLGGTGASVIHITPKETGVRSLPCRIPMGEGWGIGMKTTGDAGDSAIECHWMYTEYDLAVPARI